MGHRETPLVTSRDCFPTPKGPGGQRGGQNTTTLCIPPCSPGRGGSGRALSHISVAEAGVCFALSPRISLEGGCDRSWAVPLISAVWRDPFAGDTGLQLPVPPGSLLCSLLAASVGWRQLQQLKRHLLLLSRSLTQLFPRYGLWNRTIRTWQLSWRGWWKSGREIRW